MEYKNITEIVFSPTGGTKRLQIFWQTLSAKQSRK